MIGRDSGDGSLAAARAAVVTAGLEDAVSFQGAVAKDRVPETLASHDVFLNTSQIDNTPVSVIEALACGLPVVSTDVGGLRDLLRHEETGLLVPADDAREMAAAVIRLCDDPRLTQRLATAGRKLAETFDWSRVVGLWQETYQQTFEGR